MTEIWKDIKGYEGLYQASSQGRIRSLPRNTTKGKIINQVCARNKLRVHLCNDGKRKYCFVHILVAQAFPEICGEWFEGCQVHHKDCNPSNNNPYNLVCLTREEHNRIHREMGQRIGERNPFYGKHHTQQNIVKISRKLRKPIIQMAIDGTEIMGWLSAAECQKETRMFSTAILACCRGVRKTAYGFRWRYAS